MTRIKKPILGLITAGLAVVGVGLMVWRVTPNPVIESLTIASLTIASFIVISWISGSTKRAIQITAFGVGLLVMNRLRILGWVTGGLWTMVWGLIGLIN